MVGNDMGKFMQYQTAQAIPKLAEGVGQGGGMAGEAMGLGAGVALGQVLAQNLAQGLSAAAPAAYRVRSGGTVAPRDLPVAEVLRRRFGSETGLIPAAS